MVQDSCPATHENVLDNPFYQENVPDIYQKYLSNVWCPALIFDMVSDFVTYDRLDFLCGLGCPYKQLCYDFSCVCLSVCVCVCEQNGPILMRFLLNSCLLHWLGFYWIWLPWVKGQGHCDQICMSKGWK